MSSSSPKRRLEEVYEDTDDNHNNPPSKKRKITNEKKVSDSEEITDDIDSYPAFHGKDVHSLISCIVWKTNWQKKIESKKIIQKWKAEALKQGCQECDFIVAINLLKTMAMGKPIKIGYVSRLAFTQYYTRAGGTDEHLSESERRKLDIVDYETHWNDTQYGGNMHLLFQHILIKKQRYISANIANAFQLNMKALMNDIIASHSIDFHPGSDGKVWDIIHPSLYCYSKDCTPICDTQGIDDAYILTHNAQQSKFEFKSEPTNSMGFNCETHSMDINKYNRFQWLPSEFRIQRSPTKLQRADIDTDCMYGDIRMLSVDQSEDIEVEIESYINNLDECKYSAMYDSIGAVFARFVPLFDSILKAKLPTNVQVITKLANINLNAKESFDGGVWHLEGMAYEHIIATGIYYWKMENIRESYLEFRRAIVYPTAYEQSNCDECLAMYNTVDGQQLNEYLGKIKIEEGDCLVFPNVFQHKVRRFELADEGKKGERNILVFFLIDPNVRILSTKHVSFQQFGCLNSFVYEILKRRMPQTIVEIICQFAVPMTLEQAKQNRLDLMTERKYYYDEQNNCVFEREFSLCEH